MQKLLSKMAMMKCGQKQIILICLLISDAVIRLLCISENIYTAAINLSIGVILFWAIRVQNYVVRCLWLLATGILFYISALNMTISFYYLLSFIFPFLIIYAFLLPNPFMTIGVAHFFMPLLLQYKDTVEYGSFKGNIIGLIVSSFFYAVLVYLLKRLQQTNEVLEKSQEDTAALLSILPQAVFVHNDKVIFYVNKEGLKLLGKAKEEDIVGKHPLQLVPNQYHKIINERIFSSFQQNEVLRSDGIKVLKDDGSIMDIESSTVSFTFNGHPSLITVVNDVTVKNKETEELIRKSDKLKIVGQMAAGIAHEIRNPLTSIKGFLQLMRNHRDDEYIKIMLAELERINFIVNEFLVLAKPQSVEFKEKNIVCLMNNVIKLMETQAALHNVQITTKFEPNLPLIKCEENQLKQVFINISKNAIESMPKGGLLHIQIVKHENNKILIRLKDQGCGISKERLNTLGEPFYTTKEKGTGLGLMVCYKIIENHFGQIKIDSKIEKGTTVEVMLPISITSKLTKNEALRTNIS